MSYKKRIKRNGIFSALLNKISGLKKIWVGRTESCHRPRIRINLLEESVPFYKRILGWLSADKFGFVKDWWQKATNKKKLVALGCGSLAVAVIYTFAVAPMFTGLVDFFTPEKQEEKIIVNTTGIIYDTEISPSKKVDVYAGKPIVFRHGTNQCFFVTGNKKSGAYPISSELVYLAFMSPDGKELRIPDKISGYTPLMDGQITLFARITETGNYVWSGTDEECKTKRRSEFNDGPVTVFIERPEIFPVNIAKVVEIGKEPTLLAPLEKVKTKLAEVQKEADEAKEEKKAWWTKKGKKLYADWFESFETELKNFEGIE